ncbi:MAG: TetR/AcrR family transcriptional regulator [Brevundimonas sp.]|uniref:TetR/AcrR family transcriptional regulator n=1 Tax=Brevundimonas sp. TaxID=1871086 RepID=UPI002736E8C0|nr:TetR/AcrR family transcriptional regulator [Brevundimonas sp.]MBX9616871.1 TetR/AcrR family transcriptional regulator [Caulobacteraceae bacterium]MDP3404051.1 TetR/AcrR family transcriptional regulator [Brevundimonas sp.]
MRESASTASPSPEIHGQPRLNRRQAAKVRTRQKVLDAARGLFAERGYEPATIRDIAKGAGMSTGAVFANFQDKAELFEAVLTEDMAGLAEVMRNGAGTGATRDRLVNALSAGYHGSFDQLPLFQAIVARSWFQPVAAETRQREATQGLIQVIADILRAGIGTGELKQDADVVLLTELTWDAYLSNYRRAAYDGWTVSQLADHMARQVDALLAGVTTGQ